MPTERPVPPAPRNLRSSTTIRRTPSAARWNAMETPVTPPPTMIASAVFIRSVARGGVTGKEAHGIALVDLPVSQHTRVDAAPAGRPFLRHPPIGARAARA